MEELHILKFKPTYNYARYGGEKLKPYVKDIGIEPEQPLGSICLFSGHPKEFSVIENGSLKGKSIDSAVSIFGEKLIGKHVLNVFGPSVPIIIKLMDCKVTLPVGVHPNDDQAKKMQLPDTGKCEASYILEADENAKVYAGTAGNVTVEEIQEAARNGKTFSYLQSFPSNTGDTFFFPPGRIHAIGGGNLICEIQRNSYSVFPVDWLDWPVDDAKKAEDLSKAAEVIKIGYGHRDRLTPVAVEQGKNTRYLLCVNQCFVVEKLFVSGIWSGSKNEDTFQVLLCTEGKATVRHEQQVEVLEKYDAVMVPACQSDYTISSQGSTTLLKTHIPHLDSYVRDLVRMNVSEEMILQLGGYEKHNT